MYSPTPCVLSNSSIVTPWHGYGGTAEVPNKVTNGERPLDQLLDTSGREEPKLSEICKLIRRCLVRIAP